jgi:protein-disulfide isomerase
MIEHAVSAEELMAFADGELSGEQLATVAQHVGSCVQCADDLADWRELSARLSQWRAGVAPASITCPALPHTRWHRATRLRRAAMILAVLILILLFFSVRRPTPEREAIAPAAQQTAPPLAGESTTPVTVTLFVDWLCPACATTWPSHTAMLRRYEAETARVSFVVRDWPWNSACNPETSITIPGHEASCDAAVAVRLAKKAGQGDAMIAWLFEHQRELMESASSSQLIRDRVRDTLGVADFDAAFREELPKILDDVAEGRARSVQLTPRWFVDAAAVEGQGKQPTATQLSEAIQGALRGGR